MQSAPFDPFAAADRDGCVGLPQEEHGVHMFLERLPGGDYALSCLTRVDDVVAAGERALRQADRRMLSWRAVAVGIFRDQLLLSTRITRSEAASVQLPQFARQLTRFAADCK